MAKLPIEKSRETGSRPETGLQDVPQEQIAVLAYSYWEARGGGDGSAEEDWYRAEKELRQRSTQPQTAGSRR